MIQPINLSPSFLSRVLEKGYDYALGEKIGLVKTETTAMTDGKIMHSYLSGVFGGKVEKIAISPHDNFRTKEARDWRDSQPDDTLIIKEGEAEYYKELAERVKNHPEVQKIITGHTVETEKTVVKEFEKGTLKGILDLTATDKDGTNIIDFKYVASQVFDDFNRKAKYMNYDMQGSIYDTLVKSKNVFFVVIEKEAPNRIKVVQMSLSAFESGAEKFDRALNLVLKENWREPTFDIMGVEELVDWGY